MTPVFDGRLKGMDARSRTASALLIGAQAAHSVEEYAFRLFDAFGPARFVSSLFSTNAATGFIIANIGIVLFGLWCYVARVRTPHPSDQAYAWFWTCLELANGVGHLVLSSTRDGYREIHMINEMRTCPVCRTRVLPGRDDGCPACRRHKFDPATPDAVVRANVAEATRAEREVSVWEGARAFWLLQWAVAGTVLLSLAELIMLERTDVRGLWPAAATLAMAVAILGCAVAGLVGAYRIATWLRWGAPAVWAILAAIPYVGVVVLVVVSRTALGEFRSQGVPMRVFGPRIPARPQSTT